MVTFICLLNSPLPPGYCSAGGWVGLIKAINPLFSTTFEHVEATFDKLQFIRTTLISKNDKNLIKLINYDRIDIFHQKVYWFKIRMEFLWPILAKIELICQQPRVSGAHPSSGVPERMTGGWWGGLAMGTNFSEISIGGWWGGLAMGTNFSEISIDVHTFLFKKIHFKMLSGKWRPFSLSLKVLLLLGD